MGKLEQTDRAGKTVEAWWALLFADASLGQSAFRWGWPVIGGAVGAWVASATDWISSYGVAGWAATIMLGALGFVWIAVGIDHFRSRQRKVADLMPAPELDYQPSTHAQMHARDEKLLELDERTKALQVMLEENLRVSENQVTDLTKSIQHLKNFLEYTERETQRHFEQVDVGFAALYNREWHQRLFDELGNDYLRIAEPVKAGKGINDGTEWLRSVKSWRGKLDQWLVIAEYYAMGVAKKVLEVPDFLYDGEWGFDEKELTANQAHRFKETAIWWQNAKEQKNRVDKQLEYAAFHAPSQRAKNGSPPRPSEDQ